MEEAAFSLGADLSTLRPLLHDAYDAAACRVGLTAADVEAAIDALPLPTPSPLVVTRTQYGRWLAQHMCRYLEGLAAMPLRWLTCEGAAF